VGPRLRREYFGEIRSMKDAPNPVARYRPTFVESGIGRLLISRSSALQPVPWNRHTAFSLTTSYFPEILPARSASKSFKSAKAMHLHPEVLQSTRAAQFRQVDDKGTAGYLRAEPFDQTDARLGGTTGRKQVIDQ
jgi:hypothetical protein